MGPRLALVAAATMLLAVACSSGRSAPAPAAPMAAAPTSRGTPATRERIVHDTVRDTALERRVARLEMALLEKEAQIDDLEGRLNDARGEVVRALARLQTVANRAEAASGIAEAEIALQSLKSGTGSRAPETTQIAYLVKQSSAAFDKQNYGGALYLAGQAKALVSSVRARLGPSDRTVTRPGETLFLLSLRLKTTVRVNIRSGPGTSFPVQFSLETGNSLTGFSFVDDWIRVTDDAGRSGWISRSLVALR